MSLKDALNSDIKAGLKAGERDRVGVLRMATAAIKQREVDDRVDATDADIVAILEKMVKQRRESEKMFTEGGRDDLARKEAAEIEILKTYLPEPLTSEEVEALVAEAIAESGAESIRDMGKVMGFLKSRAAGRGRYGRRWRNGEGAARLS